MEKSQDIDLLYLLNILIKYKLTLAIILSLTLAIGFLYDRSLPLKINFEYKIKEVTESEADKYNVIKFHTSALKYKIKKLYDNKNDFDTVINSIGRLDVNDSIEIFNISPEYLSDEFIDTLKNYETIAKSLIETNAVNRGNFSSEKDYLDELEKRAANFTVNFIPQIEKYALSINVDYEENVFKNYAKLFDLILSSTNEVVRQNVLNRINQTIENYNRLIVIKKEEELINIELIRRQQIAELKSDLLEYKDQAALARNLGIKKNTLLIKNFNSSDMSIVTLSGTEQNNQITYMQGYEFLENQANLIERRINNIDQYSNAIQASKNSIFAMENDNSISMLQYSLELVPLTNKSEFEAVQINSNFFLTYNIIRNTFLNLVISLCIGLLICLITISYLEVRNKE